MRVLVATDHYPPPIGGAQIQSRLLAHELRARGHDVIVATLSGKRACRRSRTTRESLSTACASCEHFPGSAGSPRRHHQPPFPDPADRSWQLRRTDRALPPRHRSFLRLDQLLRAPPRLLGKGTPLLLTARDFAYSCANRTLMRDGEECSGPRHSKCVPAPAATTDGPGAGSPLRSCRSRGRLLLRRKSSAVQLRQLLCASRSVRRDFSGDEDLKTSTRASTT